MASPRPTIRTSLRGTRGLAAGGLALALGLAGIGWARSAPPSGHATVSPGRALTISGSIAGLYPGAPKRLRVTFRNSGRKPLRVSRLRVRVRSARRGCASRQLVVTRAPKPFRIAPRGRARRWLTVRLRPAAPDACQRARFRLSVRARTSVR